MEKVEGEGKGGGEERWKNILQMKAALNDALS